MMATNRELAEEAKSLAKTLSMEVDTTGLGNAKLTELVESLRAKTGEATKAESGGTQEGATSAGDGSTAPAATAPAASKPATPEATRPPIDGASDGSQGGPPPAAKARPKARWPFTIAPGKSVTSKRGIRGPGDEVRATDFRGGEERLAQLVAAGVVIKS
jgi:hypothetical protein